METDYITLLEEDVGEGEIMGRYNPKKPDYKGRIVGKIKRRKGYIYYVDGKGNVIEKPRAKGR